MPPSRSYFRPSRWTRRSRSSPTTPSQSYEAFVAEATKIGDLYAELAKEAYKPFELIVAKAK